jgi:hypothetical protein
MESMPPENSDEDALPPILFSPKVDDLPPVLETPIVQNSACTLWVRYEGFWGLDIGFTVKIRFNQCQEVEMSFKEPINLNYQCEPGIHTLQVKLGFRAVRVYQFQIIEPGVYAADLDYNSAWGNFSKEIYLSKVG